VKRKFPDIESYISENRFSPYLDYCNGDRSKSLVLYQMNLRLSGVFMPLISMLEVSLRNRIDGLLEDKYSSKDNRNWLQILSEQIKLDTQSGRIEKSELRELSSQLNSAIKGVETKIDRNITNYLHRYYRMHDKSYKKKSKEAKKQILQRDLQGIKSKEGYKIKKGVMIAKSNFALWTSFFDPLAYKYTDGVVLKIFDFSFAEDDEKNRKKVAERLYNIRQFRNRIAHHESIIFKSQKFEPSYPEQIRDDILSVLRLLNEDLSIYTEDISRINKDIRDIDDYCSEIKRIVGT